ncbi:hypothetical protein DTL42_11450 [Bremerella cremea]|uniref:Uncharacterized protein n=1 Tax=Bremerella cremea TaxID=1031537 RepID=A0A368KQR7_9BACT|nr:hypothetical protein [Bremerella cremea]RCS49151.1 hypothetical protein DTL42_11450 [Bremerella cremea]
MEMAEVENENDAQYLFILSILYYIMAGLNLLYCLLLLFQLYMIRSFFNNRPPLTKIRFPTEASEEFGQHATIDYPSSPFDFFGVLILIILGLAVALMACQVIAAFSIQKRRHYTFCLVIAGINCLFVPIGTILGVATFFVLVRPSVKRMFEQSSAQLG